MPRESDDDEHQGGGVRSPYISPISHGDPNPNPNPNPILNPNPNRNPNPISTQELLRATLRFVGLSSANASALAQLPRFQVQTRTLTLTLTITLTLTLTRTRTLTLTLTLTLPRFQPTPPHVDLGSNPIDEPLRRELNAYFAPFQEHP